MAIQYAPFIHGDAFTQASALHIRLSNRSGPPLPQAANPQNEDISEEDIWEGAAMAAARASSSFNEKLLSSRSSQELTLVLHSPSSPVEIPILNRKSRMALYLQVQGVAYTEEEKQKEHDESKRELPNEGKVSWRCRQGPARVAPHVIVAHQDMASRKDLQVLAFSMTEGPGRTLKGRDLTNVRNAVWHTIGFPE
ncbi:hypothetical protein GOP47_0023223 [Adiantum capillus-veneris]|uniref:Uncharacterized protein n=1 Tax=Adiantum capillus-veneris TaxID=13818 RepID=A0A9D4U8V6_ADICA|nr:hypothetical protein GOP47_0023223 [Adiantum capillus-veneris]